MTLVALLNRIQGRIALRAGAVRCKQMLWWVACCRFYGFKKYLLIHRAISCRVAFLDQIERLGPSTVRYFLGVSIPN